MRKCPKCAMMYADETKICRTCGAILDACTVPEAAGKVAPEPEAELVTMADVVEELPREDNRPADDSSENLAVWVCPQCKKSVPGNFDVCWNCFTARDGQFDPDFAEIAAADRTMNLEKADTTVESAFRKRPDRSCIRCGSDKIVRNLRVLDQGQASDGYLQVMIYGDPEALVFKDRFYGKLTADICGQCGHVELRVENPAELYEHYRKSRK